MNESYIVVIHDQIPHISLPNPSFLRSRPHPNESSTRSMSRRRHDDACAGRFVSSDESIASLLNTECDFFFFSEGRKSGRFFSFSLSHFTRHFFLKRDLLAKFSSREIKERRRPFIKTRETNEHKITSTETPVLLSACLFLAFSTKGFAFETTAFVSPLLRERERENESIPEERTDTFSLRFASRCPALRVLDDDDFDENDDGNDEREDHLFKEQNRTEDVLFKD
jgi:hypothetical protein